MTCPPNTTVCPPNTTAYPPTTIERAFALARSGDCATVNDIRLQLRAERFDQVEAHLAGPALARQLRALCNMARAPAGV